MALTLDGTNGIVSSGSITTQSATGVIFSDSSSLPAASSPYVLKNRIINGDMRIDQRNAGASVTTGTGFTYTLDRFSTYQSTTSKYSVQQNAAAVTPPTGFTNYLGVTSLSAYSVLAGDLFMITQPIEGYNIADLAWGTANAKTITLSFQVRSSLTGTFGGSILNSAYNRSYPFTYSVPTANTWTTIAVTIPGDTTGTWITTNGIGIHVSFGLGMGSTWSGTAGAWAGAQYWSATGAVSVVGTNAATWYVTGVQLEVGTSATPFERRLYNQELANCQRYYYKWINDSATAVDISLFQAYASGSAFGKLFDFPVTMRAIPTGTSSGTFKPYSATASFLGAFSGTNVDSLTKQSAGTGAWTGSSGMTAGNATGINVSVNGFIAVSAEL
jgi:hypothetical protein